MPVLKGLCLLVSALWFGIELLEDFVPTGSIPWWGSQGGAAESSKDGEIGPAVAGLARALAP